MLFYGIIVSVGDKMKNTDVFADFIHTDSAMFKHAKGMRDIYGLEFHPFYEIFLFLDGEAEFISGKFRTKLEKNSLVIIPKESFHHFVVNGSEDDYHRYVLNFTPFGKLNSLIEEKMNDIRVFPVSELVLTHFKRLDRYAKTEDQPKKELALEAALTDILLDIEMPKNSNDSSSPLLINPIIKKAVEYINKNANRITGINEIAKEINVSPSYFSHLFSKELHISPSKYLLDKKLVMANRMIDSGTNATVAAEQCGFDNYSGFYKMYKRAFGIPPSKTKRN